MILYDILTYFQNLINIEFSSLPKYHVGGSLQDQSEELLKAGPILLKNLTTSKNKQTIVYSCDDLVPKRNLLEHLERCSKAADLIMGIK